MGLVLLSTYLRMLGRIRPYLSHVVASVVFMVAFSVLSSVSIWMISPFLGTLFAVDGQNPAGQVAGLSASAPAVRDIPSAASATAPSSSAGEPRSARDDIRRKVSGLTEWRNRLKARVDGVLMRGTKMEALWRIVVVFFFLAFLKNVTGYVQNVLMTYVGQRVIKDLRDALFMKFTSLPLSFFHRHRAGELISRATNDVQIANKCVNVSFTNLVRDPIFIVMYLGLALLLSWRLTLLAMLVLPLSMVAIIQIGKKLRKYSHRQQEKLANLTSVLQETVYGIRVVKAFAMETFENRKFLQESERLFRDVFKIARMQALSSPLTEQLSVIVGLFILWYGGHQVLSGDSLPPDMFILFLVCIFSLVHPIKELSQVNNAIQEGMAAAERIFTVLDAAPEVGEENGLGELRDIRGEVEFQDVTFGYEAGKPVLHDINLVVQPGEIVALVGSSGAGKSTLVDLIPRFYDPQHGRLLVDGQDLRSLKIASLRRAMGVVTQEVLLFNDTVRNNIAYGLGDVPQDAVEAAARAANAHAFILGLPEGYQTLIGDRGVKISGGERQRLSIARAILKNPPILILDEATSALDSESEQLVQEAIDRLVRNRTTFVIAHRLSTIQNVNRIYVLQNGRIVETGTHAELLAAEGVYRDLHNLQFRS
jgi:subfamily B ATP-binding cassette protein MsbA